MVVCAGFESEAELGTARKESSVQIDRHQSVIDVLRDTPGPMPGKVLAARVGVSARSVRQYVVELNERTEGLVLATHRGYELDERIARRVLDASLRSRSGSAPMQRIFYIAKRLVTRVDGEDVFELARVLVVSDATVEADLVKVRTLLQNFDLTLHRDRTIVRIDGQEGNKRLLMRQILLNSAQGVASAGITAAVRAFRQHDLPALSFLIEKVLNDQGIDMHEYALADLTLHVLIAIDRITTGHSREVEEPAGAVDERIQRAVGALCDELETRYETEVSENERSGLFRLFAVRIALPVPDALQDDPYLTLVREIVQKLSAQYLLDLNDEIFAVNLSLHVRNLATRASLGQRARNPLRTSFKESHPLVHELAVFVASEIESGLGIHVDEDEIVYLSLHLGAYLQSTLETANRVTIAAVIPRYYGVHVSFIDRLTHHLGDTATIVETITSLHHDWKSLTADVVVSAIDIPPEHRAEVVAVSPVLTRPELDRVDGAIKTARARKSAARIRWTMSELFDPRLFKRVQRITRDEALRVMCDDLIVAGDAPLSFHEDVLERERLSPTAFGGSIAIPHSLRMDCHRTAVSILISDEPIDWAGSKVHLVAMFALSATGRHVFRDVLDEFIGALADPIRIAGVLAEATTYERFVQAVLADIR